MTPFRFFLDWEVNCQFAGLLRAREDGLFARAGLAVDLVPPSACPGAGVLELVRQGGLCAGCMEDNLIVRAVLAGGDVRAIGATMQDSPMVLMTAREGGIADLAGLAGRRVTMHADGIHLLRTVLALHAIDASTIAFQVGGWTLDQLIDGSFDAVQGYTTTEPHNLKRLGFATRLVPVRHHRMHPWAQMMFATNSVIRERPEILSAFVTACRDGWIAAMTDLPGTARLVAAHSREHDDPAENRVILQSMVPLIAGDRGLEHAVSMDPGRWCRNLETYARSGIVDRLAAYDQVVCDAFM